MRESAQWLLIQISYFYLAVLAAWPIWRFTTSPISLLIQIVRDEIDRSWEVLRNSTPRALTLGRAPFLRALRYLDACASPASTLATRSIRQPEPAHPGWFSHMAQLFL